MTFFGKSERERTFSDLALQPKGQGVLRDHARMMTQELIDEAERLQDWHWLDEGEDFAYGVFDEASPFDIDDALEAYKEEELAEDCTLTECIGDSPPKILLTWWEGDAWPDDSALPEEEEAWYESRYSEQAMRARHSQMLRYFGEIFVRVGQRKAAARRKQPRTTTAVVAREPKRKEAPVSNLQLPSDVLRWGGKLYRLGGTTLMVRGTCRVTAIGLYQVKRRLSEGFAFLETPPIYVQ